MVIPGVQARAQVRPEETYHHLLLYSVGRYFLRADGAGFLEAPALSSGVEGNESEVT